MPSIAVDANGNTAIGYSTSSTTQFPSIRYAGRLATDPIGNLTQGEAIMFNGTGSQTDTNGRFHLVYKFPAAGPTHTYPIWIRIGADGQDYPYLPGLSNHVRITVLR